MTTYPDTPAARDRWIVERRPPRNVLDPRIPYAFLAESEPGPDGHPVEIATIFLTNRECPWRCLMCDLWRNTLESTVPEGALAEQVRHALDRLPPMPPGPLSALKLYNAGSFFDPLAIPPSEHEALAELARPFGRTIVECHPTLVGPNVLKFTQRLNPGRLEVALGLETAHPEILERLNKRMTLDQFRRAAEFLRNAGIALRVFLLVRPPWLNEAEGVEWAQRSLDFAFDCGASVCSLIPTRANNGAMEALRASGDFQPPSLRSIETCLEYGIGLCALRVFADLWDVKSFATCPVCSLMRIDRLRLMNATQTIPPPIACERCS